VRARLIGRRRAAVGIADRAGGKRGERPRESQLQQPSFILPRPRRERGTPDHGGGNEAARAAQRSHPRPGCETALARSQHGDNGMVRKRRSRNIVAAAVTSASCTRGGQGNRHGEAVQPRSRSRRLRGWFRLGKMPTRSRRRMARAYLSSRTPLHPWSMTSRRGPQGGAWGGPNT